MISRYPKYRVLDEPVRLVGEVVKGFGRGSSSLGIPTANLDAEALKDQIGPLEAGVYCGWAQVDDGGVYPTCLSIGWNPFFKDNTKKTVEPHIMHRFEEDFYGATLKVLVCAYLRPELDFESLDKLIDAIKTDIALAQQQLDDMPLVSFRSEAFFGGPDTAISGSTTAAAVASAAAGGEASGKTEPRSGGGAGAGAGAGAGSGSGSGSAGPVPSSTDTPPSTTLSGDP